MSIRFVVLVLICLSAVAARADGMMFSGRETVRTEAKPSIPSQRAVLKFDGQEEILIIESVLQGPKGRYGWVVPLPSQPSYVKAVKPAYIQGTFDLVKPSVRPMNERVDLLAISIVSVLVCAAMLTAGMRYRKLDPGVRVLLFFVEGAVGLFVLMNLAASHTGQMQYMGAAVGAVAADKAMARPKVDVRSLGTIGSYEVNVVSGKTGKPLLDWMNEHDIKMPDEALPVIDSYAKDGWCFLAAEFRKTEDWPLPPHPLKAVFPTTKPIYPMRLTGLQDGPLHLELVVVSDKRAEVEPLKGWKCVDDPVLVDVPQDADLDRRIYSDWKGQLYAMAKDGAIVSYLRGDLAPSQMRDDYRVSLKPYQRYEAVVLDRSEARTHAWLLIALCLPIGAGMVGFVGAIVASRAALLGGIGALAALGIASVIASTWYGSVEKVDTVESSETPYSIGQ